MYDRFLDKMNNRSVFVALSFILRILEGIGVAANTTASITIVCTQFEHCLSWAVVSKIQDDFRRCNHIKKKSSTERSYAFYALCLDFVKMVLTFSLNSFLTSILMYLWA